MHYERKIGTLLEKADRARNSENRDWYMQLADTAYQEYSDYIDIMGV